MANEYPNQPQNTLDNTSNTEQNNITDQASRDAESARLLQRQPWERPARSFTKNLTNRSRQIISRPKVIYRNWLLLLTGLLCLTVLLLVLTFLWGSIAYLLRLDVDTAVWVPLLIFMGSLAGATSLITALSKGGTAYAVLCLWLISSLGSFLLAGTSDINFAGALGRLALSFIVSIGSFTLVKLYYLRKGQTLLSGKGKRAA